MSVDLWATIREQSARAHAAGAMYRIESDPFFVEDGGVEFVVRRARDFARQLAAMPKQPPGNPFAPPEAPLFVADVSPTHYALLNKYHVIENHLLVVTRAFVDQEVPHALADFEALVRCLPDPPALGFYNGGMGGGASQPHKHLQVVTLPMSPRAELPMAALLESDPARLPFRHAFARIDSRDPGRLLECYRALLEEAGVRAVARDAGERQSAPYNMLLARGWMLVVPRSRDRFEGVLINSLAFGGSLFVREDRHLEAVRQMGPMALLAHVVAA